MKPLPLKRLTRPKPYFDKPGKLPFLNVEEKRELDVLFSQYIRIKLTSFHSWKKYLDSTFLVSVENS